MPYRVETLDGLKVVGRKEDGAPSEVIAIEDGLNAMEQSGYRLMFVEAGHYIFYKPAEAQGAEIWG